jgi:hypothetical protein
MPFPLRIFIGLLLPSIFSFSQPSFGLESSSKRNSENNLVEVHIPGDPSLPYNERREASGWYFGISLGQIKFDKFISVIDGKTYSELFGKATTPLFQLEVAYKYNFFLGSIVAGLEVGQGRLSDNLSGSERNLELKKQAVVTRYMVDNLLAEPYVVPYLGLGYHRFEITESSPLNSVSEMTDFSSYIAAGVLLQLDWIDYETSKRATASVGLQNTFIDIYAHQYLKSASVADPDLSTDFVIGAGLRLEF